MAKTLAQIQADPKYKYTDKAGKVRERTLNIPHYFREIPFIYSPLLEKGRVKFSATMQKLYCCVKDWEKSGSVCYEEQSELAKVCGLSRGKTNELIGEMVLIGLLSRDPIDRRRNKELRALPLTDTHVIPPDQLSAVPESDVVQQQPEPMPAPEPAFAEELNAPDLDGITGEPTQNINITSTTLNNEEISELHKISDWIASSYDIEGGKGAENFMEFASMVAKELDFKLPTGIEFYFKEHHRNIYDEITDKINIDALCDLLSKPDSLQQHKRGDTFIDFARRVLRLKRKILPHKLEKGLEERYASRHPDCYNSRFDDFDIPF